MSLAAKESELRTQDPGMSQNQIAYQGNEAGRAATVATVEQLTGVHIDHFAEINLDGFYELAKRARRRGGLPEPPGPARP